MPSIIFDFTAIASQLAKGKVAKPKKPKPMVSELTITTLSPPSPYKLGDQCPECGACIVPTSYLTIGKCNGCGLLSYSTPSRP